MIRLVLLDLRYRGVLQQAVASAGQAAPWPVGESQKSSVVEVDGVEDAVLCVAGVVWCGIV